MQILKPHRGILSRGCHRRDRKGHTESWRRNGCATGTIDRHELLRPPLSRLRARPPRLTIHSRANLQLHRIPLSPQSAAHDSSSKTTETTERKRIKNAGEQASADETETEIERTVDAHTVEMPRVQNSIGLYAHITGIKWNYETDGDIMAGWLLPRGGSSTGAGKRAAARGEGDRATVEGFQFDAAGKDDFEVANKLWDIIDGRERAMVEA